MPLKSLDFREKCKEAWNDLERMLMQVANKGLHNLSPAEVLKMSKLYRVACSSLCVAQNISLDKNLHEYLENLVTRSYLTLYCSRHGGEHTIQNFFLRDFPTTVRRYRFYHLTAFLCLLLGIVTGYFTTSYDSSYYFIFVSRAEERTPYSSKATLAEVLKVGREAGKGEKAFFASFLFTHNASVGFLCFGLGILLGLPTIYLLFTNGAMLGAMSYVYHMNDLAFPWWAWILPHGITEFLAIILCGGCGLMLASCLIVAGPYGRRHRLKTMGRSVGVTAVGTIAMFFIAGVIESFFRQTGLSDFPRYVMAFLTLVGWTYYFGFLRERGALARQRHLEVKFDPGVL